MSKTFIRFVALLVVARLIADPASTAAIAAIKVSNQTFRSDVSRVTAFNEEAMSVPGLAFHSFCRMVMTGSRIKTSLGKILHRHTLTLQTPRLRWDTLPTLRTAWGSAVGGGRLLDWEALVPIKFAKTKDPASGSIGNPKKKSAPKEPVSQDAEDLEHRPSYYYSLTVGFNDAFAKLITSVARQEVDPFEALQELKRTAYLSENSESVELNSAEVVILGLALENAGATDQEIVDLIEGEKRPTIPAVRKRVQELSFLRSKRAAPPVRKGVLTVPQMMVDLVKRLSDPYQQKELLRLLTEWERAVWDQARHRRKTYSFSAFKVPACFNRRR
jgi:hypothetical protein